MKSLPANSDAREAWYAERYNAERLRRLRAGDQYWDGFFTLNGPAWKKEYKNFFLSFARQRGWPHESIGEWCSGELLEQAAVQHWDRSPQRAAELDIARIEQAAQERT